MGWDFFLDFKNVLFVVLTCMYICILRTRNYIGNLSYLPCWWSLVREEVLGSDCWWFLKYVLYFVWRVTWDLKDEKKTCLDKTVRFTVYGFKRIRWTFEFYLVSENPLSIVMERTNRFLRTTFDNVDLSRVRGVKFIFTGR